MKPFEIVIAAALVLVSISVSYTLVRLADATNELNRPSECNCVWVRHNGTVNGHRGDLLPAK